MKKILFLLFLMPLFAQGAVIIKGQKPDSTFGTIQTDVNSSLQTNIASVNGVIDTNNSTSTALLAGATFTGEWCEILDISSISVSVYSNVASATDGLAVQYSSDGVNVDNSDLFTLNPGGESYTFQPAGRYLRIIYTNGATNQTSFRLQTILRNVPVKPSSHRLGDDVSSEDDAELQKSVLSYLASPENIYKNVSIQNPLPVDGDAVYEKDIWVTESDSGGFSGSVTNLFNNLHTIIYDSSATNPKEITIHFNRSVISSLIGLGAFAGSFSNVKIIGVLSGDVETTLRDESASGTKYTTRTFNLPVTYGLNAIIIQFHTADPIILSNCVILKSKSVVSRLQATKPDNTVIDINATSGGNLKISLEELENAISTNSNSQLKTTVYNSSGLEQRIDSVTSSLTVVNFEHHEIHEGEHYTITMFDTLATLGDSLMFCVTVPDTIKRAHMTFDFGSQLLCQLFVYEGITCVMSDTLTAINNDRNSSNVSMLLIGPASSISGGTLIEKHSFGSGTNPGNARPGDSKREAELILKNNTKYAFLFITGANSNIVDYNASWYEHTPGN